MKLFPAIVTLHLIGGTILLALLCVSAASWTAVVRKLASIKVTRGLRTLFWIVLALLTAQVLLGGWVSTNYAVLACTDFPNCQNSFWPVMDFKQGFTLWRELGAGHEGGYITFQALTAIHYVHRLAAYAVFVVLMLLAFRLQRIPALRQQARWLAGLTLLQIITGLSNVVLGWPLFAAVAHTGGAAALVVVLTGIVFSSRKIPVLSRISPLNAARLSA